MNNKISTITRGLILGTLLIALLGCNRSANSGESFTVNFLMSASIVDLEFDVELESSLFAEAGLKTVEVKVTDAEESTVQVALSLEAGSSPSAVIFDDYRITLLDAGGTLIFPVPFAELIIEEI